MSSNKFAFTYHIDHRKQGDDEDTYKMRYEEFKNNKKNWKDAEWREKTWKKLSDLGMKFIWCQMEVGEDTHRTHIQGYLEYNKKTTAPKVAFDLKEVLGGASYRAIDGSVASNIVYCGKEDTRIAGPWTWGKLAKERQGQRTDLENVKNMARDGASPGEIARAEPDTFIRYCKGIEKLCDAYNEAYSQEWTVKQRREELSVHVIWGAPGVGKTRQVYDNHPQKEIYSLRRPNGNSLWFCGYHKQKVLLIDEFKGWIPFQQLLKLLDIYPMQVDKKGGHCFNNWNCVYIISNRPPKEWYPGITPYEKKALFRRFTTVTEVTSEEDDSSSTSGNEDCSSCEGSPETT